jgi:hypothetical protein
MVSLIRQADLLLRTSNRLEPALDKLQWWTLPLIVAVFAPIYGAMMGSYDLDSLERVRQVAYSAAKLPLLFFGVTLVCLPGFFVLNTVFGLREDFREAMRAILAGQAALSIVLASLGPITRFLYFCNVEYGQAIILNLAMLSVSTIAAQFVIMRLYRVLITRNRNHLPMIVIWLLMYSFVGIQMAWILRPFVGDPAAAVTFFRAEPFSNAYIVVLKLLSGA